MAKHTRHNTRFEMQASEEWFHLIDEWRKNKRGVSRAEAIRTLCVTAIASERSGLEYVAIGDAALRVLSRMESAQ